MNTQAKMIALFLVVTSMVIAFTASIDYRTDEEKALAADTFFSRVEGEVHDSCKFSLTDSSFVTQFIQQSLLLTDTSYKYYMFNDYATCMKRTNNHTFCSCGEPIRRGRTKNWNIDITWLGTSKEDREHFRMVLYKDGEAGINSYAYSFNEGGTAVNESGKKLIPASVILTKNGDVNGIGSFTIIDSSSLDSLKIPDGHQFMKVFLSVCMEKKSEIALEKALGVQRKMRKQSMHPYAKGRVKLSSED